MLDVLQGFVHELRAAGLPVSMTENLDAMRAVEHVNISEREVFKAALGLTIQQAEWLREQALKIAVTGEAVRGSYSVFGDTYVIDAMINHKGTTASVRFCWIIEFGTDFPRLTSCYIRRR